MNKRRALIIGAGPAGLTAAYELATRTDIQPVVFEIADGVGGISRTYEYRGNRIDLGGHRFFSKSDRVMKWWLDVLPLQGRSTKEDYRFDIHYHGKRSTIVFSENGPDPETHDRVMLVRRRISRILFRKKFFSYPVKLTLDTLKKFGLWYSLRVALSYIRIRVVPVKPERSLEDYIINRFGRVLYETFFRDYTNKLWLVPASEISPEWGAQRIKGISISAVIKHYLTQLFRPSSTIAQKQTETSLIEQFLYPKFGPGQMWEEVARSVQSRSGELHLNTEVVGLTCSGDQIMGLTVRDLRTGDVRDYQGEYVFSTMPVQELIARMTPAPPEPVQRVALGLEYLDFISVGVLCKRLSISEQSTSQKYSSIPDNWVYVQDPGVKVLRLQVFNNWSPYLVKDPDTVWVGMEYTCKENDWLWSKTDEELKSFAVEELLKLGVVAAQDVLDGTVIRMKKAYPGYFGTYGQFQVIREFTDRFENLFLIGRNGMHKYNNQDHSMLTAMTAVDFIVAGTGSKSDVWDINTEEAYHETK